MVTQFAEHWVDCGQIPRLIQATTSICVQVMPLRQDAGQAHGRQTVSLSHLRLVVRDDGIFKNKIELWNGQGPRHRVGQGIHIGGVEMHTSAAMRSEIDSRRSIEPSPLALVVDRISTMSPLGRSAGPTPGRILSICEP